MSISALSQSAVEEKIKWRQDENDIDGETATATAKSSSPTTVAAILSRNSSRLGQNQQIYSPNAGKKAKGPVINYYVVLEKSPPRVSSEESDTSTYDKSFHCRETDFCQDSTDADSSSGDDDSFATEGMTNIDYLEYEVASASDDDADSVLNSSSGTDDHGLVVAAAVVGSLDTTSSNSDFADSEESDSDKLFDKELSEADFWECIQCRNPNNNPLYPMCEKCYKIRRTHFPPRPKPRKKKLNRLRKLADATNSALTEKISSDVSVSTSQDGEVSKRLCSEVVMGKEGFNANATSGYNSFKRRKLSYTNNNKSQLNSAAETSDEDSRERKSPYNRFRRETVSTNLSSSGRSSLNIINRLATASVNRKRSSSISYEKEMWLAKKVRLESSKTLSSADTECDTDNESVALLARNNTQKDSGVSSAPSSQEPPLSSCSDEKSVEKDDLMKPTNGNLRDNTVRAQVVGVLKQSDELTAESLFSGIKHSNLIRSVSDINPLNNNLSSDTFSMSSLDPSFSTYGSCTMCFSGPKNGVFVHTNNVHLCSCYKCAVRIWSKDKKCPVCNVSAKNVLKLFVH